MVNNKMFEKRVPATKKEFVDFNLKKVRKLNVFLTNSEVCPKIMEPVINFKLF
jgi:hypothetical protein